MLLNKYKEKSKEMTITPPKIQLKNVSIPTRLQLDDLTIENNNGTLARVFSRAIGLIPKDRTVVKIRIEKELLQAYESHYPRTNNGKFHGASLSDDMNRAFAVWLKQWEYID